MTASRVLVVNAGSSSVKLRLLEADDSLTWSADLATTDGEVDDGELADALHGAGPCDAVGHRVVHGGTRFRRPAVIDDANGRRPGRADPARALAPTHRRRAHPGRPTGPSRHRRGRVLRHRLPRHTARGRRHLCRPRGLARGARGPKVRLPWPGPCVGGPPGRGAGRPPHRGAPDRDVPPRCRGLAGRRGAGCERRHHHGLHAARRPRHGHPIGFARPRPRALADHPGRADARGRRGRPLPLVGSEGPGGHRGPRGHHRPGCRRQGRSRRRARPRRLRAPAPQLHRLHGRRHGRPGRGRVQRWGGRAQHSDPGPSRTRTRLPRRPHRRRRQRLGGRRRRHHRPGRPSAHIRRHGPRRPGDRSAHPGRPCADRSHRRIGGDARTPPASPAEGTVRPAPLQTP